MSKGLETRQGGRLEGRWKYIDVFRLYFTWTIRENFYKKVYKNINNMLRIINNITIIKQGNMVNI